MVIIKKSTDKNAEESVEKREPSCTVGGNVNWYSHYGEQYGGSLKTKNRATMWSSNPTPGHVSGEKTILWKDTCIPVFIAALFTVAKQQRNGWRSCGTYKQWNITQP